MTGKKQIRKIEVDLESRVETGPTRVGDDWPGVFIRGDNAVIYASHLESVLKQYPRCLEKHVLEGLADLLRSGWSNDNTNRPSWAQKDET